jgi:hypothetical protein
MGKIYTWMKQNGATEIPYERYFEISDGFTIRELDDYKLTAREALEAYRISGEPRSWWYGFSQSLAAAFVYSLLLVAAALIVRFFGSDLATVVRFIFFAQDG